MNGLDKKYILILFLCSLFFFVLGLLGYFVASLSNVFSSSLLWVSIVIFAVFLLHNILTQKKKLKGGGFISMIILGTGLRMIILLSVFLIRFFIDSKGIVPFTLGVGSNYIILLIAEVFYMNRTLKSN
ncbi:MAG: hypothetical protein ACEPOW_08965 [Bacteroidales bacterium]